MGETRAGWRGDARVMAVFFVQPIAFGAWLTRIPDVQHALGLDTSDLALALMGLPIGIVLTLPFAGRLVARIGPRATFLAGFPLYLLLVALPGFAPTPSLLFAALLLVGVALSTMELSLNVAADRHEAGARRLVMQSCHGFWALGIMAGSLLGVLLAGLAAGPAVAIGCIAMLPVTIFVSWCLPSLPTLPADGSAPLFSLPTRALAGACAFVFGTTLTEGAVADWSALYLRQMLHALPSVSGLGYTAFAGLLAAGRFVGDRLKARHGAHRLGLGAILVALLGLTLVLWAPTSAVAIAGFGVLGLGVSVGFPLAVSAAGAMGDRPAAINIAAVAQVALVGFVVGPPLIGFIAQSSSLRIGLAALLPLLVVSALTAGGLREWR